MSDTKILIENGSPETQKPIDGNFSGGSSPELSSFSPAMPWTVSTVTTVGILLVVLGDWILQSEAGDRRIGELLDSMTYVGEYIVGNGWGIIAVCVSLLAISVTAVSIIGLENFERINSNRRHELIFSLSGTFVNGAICLSTALIFGTIFPGISALSHSEGDSAGESSVVFLLLLGISVLLWLWAKATHEKLREVAQSDHDSRLRELEYLDGQLRHYRKMHQKAAGPLRKRKVNLEEVRFASEARWTCFYSALYLVGASVLASLLVWVPAVGGNYSGELTEFERSWRVFLGALGLSVIVMILTALPFMMSADYLKAREVGWKGVAVAIFSIGISCCLPLVVVAALGWGIFNGFESPPGWANWSLFALVLAPTVCAIFFPLKHSWVVLSNVSAVQQLQSKILPLNIRMERAKAGGDQRRKSHTSLASSLGKCLLHRLQRR